MKSKNVLSVILIMLCFILASCSEDGEDVDYQNKWQKQRTDDTVIESMGNPEIPKVTPRYNGNIVYRGNSQYNWQIIFITAI
jgi:hypothetical protein